MASSSNNIEERMDEYFDQAFDNYFDKEFENRFNQAFSDQQEATMEKPKRSYIERDREDGHRRLWDDYFSDDATYPPRFFRRRFRMNKSLFLRIVERLSAEVPYFRQRQDATGRFGLSALQKSTAAIRMMAYGCAADAVDEYLQLAESTAMLCLEQFVEGVINLFGDEYLRRPTVEDLQRLLAIGEWRGFPGMIDSIDCMHWEWKNCPTAWKGQYTRRSGKPTIVLEAVASQDLSIWHAFFGPPDGIYPNWVTFIQSIPMPADPKASLFATCQEATRKDVERAFGVLQARFAIVRNPTLFLNKKKIGKIMRACIILHNMIVEDERDEATQFDKATFTQADSSRTPEVDLSYSTETPSNVTNLMSNIMSKRKDLRDRKIHQRLKADLVENIWQKFRTN
ncbi:PREDICTED: uncharacterized protein LOC104777507 isoform X1 [Camelina sativa]|uniref:Uncharacterized protein LOC104777507 isoform X1 n=1 Tax=Camelina sativa TaxID=90675 RepID=A0ABM0YFB7_CAMSA|nr:PREDICTED: uncharacterized protein LOC104777507 isoform X1 [Camelina sativa]